MEHKQVLYTIKGGDIDRMCESILKKKLERLNEKFVLKVPTNNTPDFGPMPPFGGGATPPMPNSIPDVEEPDFPDTNDEMDNEMDGEEYSPRKTIEKATGKLSQDIRNYIKDNQDSSELCKYVVGMIVSAAAGVLSNNDKQEVIKKMNKATNDTPADGNMDMQGDDPGMQDSDQTQPDKTGDQPMNETFLDNMDNNRRDDTVRPQGRYTTRKRPFIPKF